MAKVKVNVPGKEVKENDQPLQEEKSVDKTQSRRQSTRGESKVNERPATKRKLKGGRASGRDPFWYLKHEGELELVTNEGFNPDLGIKDIQVWEASDAQWQNGTLANITLVMDYVEIKGIQVRESVRDDSGAIYLQMQSRSWEKDGQKQYMNDVTLGMPVIAQILSFVEDMLEDAK